MYPQVKAFSQNSNATSAGGNWFGQMNLIIMVYPIHRKWSYDVGGKGWGNKELQYYTDADTNNVVVL